VAHSKDEQGASYPLVAYNFRVTVDGRSMSFAEVSGLKREHHTQTYRHGLSAWEGEDIVKYRYDKYEPIILKKGSVRGATFLHEWLETKQLNAIEISLCDEVGTPVLTWQIAKAVPVKLDAPRFDAKSNDIAIESLEIQASGVFVKDVS